MPARIEHIEGHSSLGYTRDGGYRCQCGQFFPFDLQNIENRSAILALKDQWQAHREEHRNAS